MQLKRKLEKMEWSREDSRQWWETRQQMKETVLYGLPKGTTERHEEVLLLTNGTPERIERAKKLATLDGYHSFRTAEIDLTQAPDFSKGVKRL